MDLTKLKELFKQITDQGVPVLILKDPLTSKPSVTFSLFYLNGLIALAGLLGRFAKLVAGVDADAAKELLIVTGSLYLGRAITRGLSTKNEEGK